MTNPWLGKGAIAVLALALIQTACSSARQQTMVPENELAGLSRDSLNQVDQQRRTLNEAKLELETARRAEQEAKSRKQLAETEVEVANAKLEQAKIQAEMQKKAQKKEESSSKDKKTNAEEQAQAEVDAAKAKVEYLDGIANVTTAERELAERYVELAEARLEQAKFDAVATEKPQRVSEMEVQSQDFVAASAEAQSNLASARAKVAQQRASALESYEKWLNLERELGTTGRRATAPPPPSGEPTR